MKEKRQNLETLKTVKSGKDAFFPQSETLYTCVRDGKKLTVEPEELRSRPFVVFGMKACDVKGVAVLDKVFLADPVDTFYAARRDHGTIVALACHEPEESCFCKVFGTDAADPEADADGKRNCRCSSLDGGGKPLLESPYGKRRGSYRRL